MLSVKDILDHLKTQGYTANLVAKDGQLHLNDKELNINQTHIDGTYRVESDSDPTHQTVIYSISCTEPPIKGVIVNSHGPLADKEKQHLIERLETSF